MSRDVEALSIGCLIGAGIILLGSAVISAWKNHHRRKAERDKIQRRRVGAKWAEFEHRQAGRETQ